MAYYLISECNLEEVQRIEEIATVNLLQFPCVYMNMVSQFSL